MIIHWQCSRAAAHTTIVQAIYLYGDECERATWTVAAPITDPRIEFTSGRFPIVKADGATVRLADRQPHSGQQA